MSAIKSQPQPYLDRAAMWLSGLCLVHCLALPLAVLLTPTMSHWLEATETTTHWILFGIAIPISVIALVQGYRRLRSVKTLLLGGIGLLLMLVAVSLQWLLFLPAVYVLGPLLQFGLIAIWLAMLAWRGLQTGLFVWLWQRGGWRHARV